MILSKNKLISVTIIFFVLLSFSGFSSDIIKVACIGNSITYGSGIKERIKDSYPAQLGRMLGNSYLVKNFGVGGRTMLSKGDYPYINESAYKKALEFNPDVVIIKLGTNDSKPQNWKFASEFETDYLKLIQSFQDLSSQPEIYLCKAVPVYADRWGINKQIVKNIVNPLVEKIAHDKKLHLIDLYTPFIDKSEWFPDHIHPNVKGAGEMAKIIFRQLVGKDGELVDQQFPGEKSMWLDFDRFDFDFNEKAAHVVIPHKALPGNPWVWRARFPGWHTEMDSILLSEGFYIAFINTNNQYGSPKAMTSWDAFYNYLTKLHGLSEKVSLEGVSRGGLFVYSWAKRHPEKVNCIYTEAPVCDFTSWPGGFGNGKGSKADWERLKIEFGFTSDERAKTWKSMPMDSLGKLADFRVPILHMIGLNDKVVPPEENTYKLINRYIKLGGPATIVPCTTGEQDLWGHHFAIETPRLGADFILYNTELPQQKLDAGNYHNLRKGIRNSLIKFERTKKGRVAFLGGSITYNGGWRDSVCNYLQNRFPDTFFEFIAAGIPSMGTTPAAFRLERDVLSKGKIDLLFEEAAVNDEGNGRMEEEQIRGMEGIVRHMLEENPECDIIMMHFVDPNKMKTYREGNVPEVIQNHEKVAEHYGLPSINLAKEITERIDAGEFTWKNDFINLHPSSFGQGIYAHSMIIFFENAWNGFVAEDDKVVARNFPVKVDDACYDSGKLLSINDLGNIKGWKYVENWTPNDGAGTRANYTHVPMLIGSHPGKVIKFKFEGSVIGIAVAAGSDAGIIEYSVDGKMWEKLDLYTKWSGRLHLPWYHTLKSGLKPGKHFLQLRVVNEKNPKSKGQICRIRYFYVNK